jgi:hypothetical protein
VLDRPDRRLILMTQAIKYLDRQAVATALKSQTVFIGGQNH